MKFLYTIYFILFFISFINTQRLFEYRLIQLAGEEHQASVIPQISLDWLDESLNSFGYDPTTPPPFLVPTLPVELISFNTKRINPDEVKLDWATTTEVNNRGFYIERMLDIEGVFETIGFVESHNYYNTIDENSYTGISYYRLKQVDYDGSFNYSDVKVVEGIQIQSVPNIGATVFPNPIEINLKIRSEELPKDVSSATIRVTDVQSKIVHTLEPKIH